MSSSVHCNPIFSTELLTAFHQAINYIANGSVLQAGIQAPHEGQESHPYGDSSYTLIWLASADLFSLLGLLHILIGRFFASANVKGVSLSSIPGRSFNLCLVHL